MVAIFVAVEAAIVAVVVTFAHAFFDDDVSVTPVSFIIYHRNK